MQLPIKNHLTAKTLKFCEKKKYYRQEGLYVFILFIAKYRKYG